MFNMCSKGRKIQFDKWTILDSLCAILNVCAVYLISKSDPEIFLPSNPQPDVKDFVDYFMIIVLVTTWLRFFVYFLVVRNISKLLLTLSSMIGDTLSFMFIFSCFVLLMASVFTTLYQDTNPVKFGGFALTIRTLFDACLANYDYDDMPGREISYSCLIIFHVFFANILLMNYLIAILSTTYDSMKENGIFKYKVNLYTYCERFIVAFQDRAYGEMILHPPPLTYFVFPYLVMPTFFNQSISVFMNYLSMTMYYIENCIFVVFFLVMELVCIGPTWIKVFFNITLAVSGIKQYFYFFLWLVFGVPACLLFVVLDC
jgi:hypothetical protein